MCPENHEIERMRRTGAMPKPSLTTGGRCPGRLVSCLRSLADVLLSASLRTEGPSIPKGLRGPRLASQLARLGLWRSAHVLGSLPPIVRRRRSRSGSDSPSLPGFSSASAEVSDVKSSTPSASPGAVDWGLPGDRPSALSGVKEVR